MKLSGLHGWLVFGWYEHWDVGFICVKFSRACFSHVRLRQTKPQQGKARTTTVDFPPMGILVKLTRGGNCKFCLTEVLKC